jgi:hypothetical protein
MLALFSKFFRWLWPSRVRALKHDDIPWGNGFSSRVTHPTMIQIQPGVPWAGCEGPTLFGLSDQGRVYIFNFTTQQWDDLRLPLERERQKDDLTLYPFETKTPLGY